MRATMDRLTVKDALTVIGRTVKGRPSIPVLDTVHVEAYDRRITFTASNMSDTVRVTVDATDVENGSVLIDRKTLAGIVKNGPDTVTVTADTDGVTFGPVSLPVTFPVSDFPTLPEPGRFAGALTAADRETLGTVSRFASTDDGRPVLTGAYFNGSEVAATDSYRLATGDLSTDALDGALVPARAVSVVGKWKVSDPSVQHGVAVHRTERLNLPETVTFAGTLTAGPKRAPRLIRVSYTVETIEGTFPNYPKLIPARGDTDREALLVHVDRSGLLAALETVMPLAVQRPNTPVSLTLQGTVLALSVSVDGSEAAARVPVHVENADRFGWSFGIAFNPTFLKDAVSALPEGPVSFTFRDALKPSRIDHVDRDGTALLMPMRVS